MSPKRFPAVEAKEVIKVLQKVGFQIARQSGSHVILKRAKDNRRTIVPVHAKKILKRKTLKAILVDADLTLDEFKALLR